MYCRKCGKPMGNNRICSFCEKEAKKKRKRTVLWSLLGGVAAAALALVLIFAIPWGSSGKHHVEIEIQDFGTISVELDADSAPITVENFLSLAQSGFYNGLTFHRIQEGFMMQGGDPNGNGTGGSAQTIKGEFTANGVDNSLSHTRGAISMARSSAYDSASSQFFICHADCSFLDGDYAVFGYVTDGMDVVDAVCAYASTVERDSNSVLGAEDQPVITEIRVID